MKPFVVYIVNLLYAPYLLRKCKISKFLVHLFSFAYEQSTYTFNKKFVLSTIKNSLKQKIISVQQKNISIQQSYKTLQQFVHVNKLTKLFNNWQSFQQSLVTDQQWCITVQQSSKLFNINFSLFLLHYFQGIWLEKNRELPHWRQADPPPPGSQIWCTIFSTKMFIGV